MYHYSVFPSALSITSIFSTIGLQCMQRVTPTLSFASIPPWAHKRQCLYKIASNSLHYKIPNSLCSQSPTSTKTVSSLNNKSNTHHKDEIVVCKLVLTCHKNTGPCWWLREPSYAHSAKQQHLSPTSWYDACWSSVQHQSCYAPFQFFFEVPVPCSILQWFLPNENKTLWSFRTAVFWNSPFNNLLKNNANFDSCEY